MTRTLDASILAAYDQESVWPVYFVELQTTPVDRYHTALGTINWGGNDWTGVGEIYQLESLTETAQVAAQPLRMGLNGLEAAVSNLVYSAQWYERPCLLYLGAFDVNTGQLISDPSLIFSGLIQELGVEMAGDNGDLVKLTAESELIFFERSRNIRYTDAQLQTEYPGDKGFQYLEIVANQKVVWRGRSNRLGGNGAAGGGVGSGGDRGEPRETFR